MSDQSTKISATKILAPLFTYVIITSIPSVHAQWAGFPTPNGADGFGSAARGNLESTATPGAPGNTDTTPYPTGGVYHNPFPYVPSQPSVPDVPNTTYMPYVNPALPGSGFAAYGQLARSAKGVRTKIINNYQLPATNLDSFVKNAGGEADMIYGDEGVWGPPLLMDFASIGAGIHGMNNRGLTTGQSSYLPAISSNGYTLSGSQDPQAAPERELPRHVRLSDDRADRADKSDK